MKTESKSVQSQIEGMFSQIHGVAQTALLRVKELDRRTDELMQERATLQRRVLRKEDFLEVMRGRVRGEGNRFGTLLAKTFRKEDCTVLAAENTYLGTDLLGTSFQIAPFNAVLPALCYYCEDQVMAGISRALDQLDWPTESDSLSLSEIVTRIAEIDDEVERVVDERNSFADVLKSYEIIEG